MKLQGRVALVTGASKGIGAAIAIEAAREGADVLINYRSDHEGAEKVLDAVKSLDRKGMIHAGDVGRKADVDAMIAKGFDHFGVIDILINNAGIALWKPFLELDEENWDRTLATNLKSVFLCSQAFARRLVEKKKQGSIVNISSIAGFGAIDCLVPYCVSKGGMHSITTAMATELGPYGIRVNALAPGPIDTERNRQTDPAFPGSCKPFIPRGQVGSVEEVAKPAIFLASDEASHITGQCFSVDGGQTAYIPMSRADFAR